MAPAQYVVHPTGHDGLVANKEYYLAELKGIRLSIINESKQGVGIGQIDEDTVSALIVSNTRRINFLISAEHG